MHARFPRYFEDLIAAAVAADAEANAPLEEVLTEDERDEVAKLRGAVKELSNKYEGILDNLRADEVGGARGGQFGTGHRSPFMSHI